VIRTTSDQGVVYLMDDRFSRPDVAALLPSWWHVEPLRVGRSVAVRSKNTKQHQEQNDTEGNTE
jgi:Rad3-related DNA helicase